MAEIKMKSDIRRPGRWRRRLLIAVGMLVVLLVVAYFVVTSSGFVTKFIVPKAGAALNSDISLGSAQISPFSKVVLRDLKVTPKGEETLLTANEVTARYSLMSILRGKIAVDEVTVVSPVITVVEKADGSRNLDPLLNSQKAGAEEKPSEVEAGKPLVVDVKSVNVKNATVRYVKHLKDRQDTMEMGNVNLTVTDVKNGGTGKLDLSAALAMDQKAATASESAALQALLTAGFGFNLTEDLKPGTVKGNASFTIGQATGTLAELNGLAAKLECETSPTEIKQLALVFSRAGARLGEMRVSGPFDVAKTEGKLKVAVLSLDRQVLNLAGAASGMDFGTTTVNSTNEIELAKAGQLIGVVGQLNVAKFQVKKDNQTTPTLDLRCDYNVTVDQAGQSALVKVLNLAGTQGGRPLLQTELTSPMPIAWGSSSSSMGDAALNLTVANFNLADWQAFAADLSPQGVANAKAKLLSQQGGKQLGFDLDTKVDNFSARLGSKAIDRVNVAVTARGSAANLQQFKFDAYRLELAQQGQPALTVSGSGAFDQATEDADLQMAAQGTLARLLALMPQPDVHVTAGALDFKGRLTSKDKNRTVSGQLGLADFTGIYGDYRFANFGAGLDLDVGMKGERVDIRKAAGHLQEGQRPGGKFEASGQYDLGRKAGQIVLKLADFNENGLRPFVESALGDKKLVSVALNTTAMATMEANGDAAIKADARVANLVVNDSAGTLPTTPLEARVQVDTSVAKSVAQIRQCQLTLTPTERSKNELGLTGTVDYSKTNAITGSLKLAAESLDVTRYYDLFAGKQTPAATKPDETRPATPAATPPAAEKEPDAVQLPFQNFVFEANIGRFYLHEVDIANLQATAKLDGGHALVKPFQLTLNGAPVNATVDLDLGVPGYKYDVAFNANAIPLAPLVNTFVPERKGQVGGTTTANAQIKGAGVTGASLQKNLSGAFGFMSTNMNLSIADVRSPLLNSIINVIVGIPELIRNPAATLGNLVAGLAGGGGQRGGWADQLTGAPIDVILASGKASEGRVTLDQAEVRSTAFQAQAAGNVTLAPILTNSTIRIPVNVLLSRSMGDKIGLVTADTPTNAFYVPMPQFVTMKGTLGEPKTDINKLALVALAAKAGGGVVQGIGGATGEKVGGVLNVVGGLLGGGKSATTTTNEPSATVTNQQPNLLDLFRRPKKK